MMSWLKGDHSGLVQLPDNRRLYLQGAGPQRTSKSDPAVVIVYGLCSSTIEWLAVQRLVSNFARTYVYERAGYFPSDPPPTDKPPTAKNIAADLKLLLETAAVPPPYVLVGHSLGGLLIRQFLADYGKDFVSGMVIVDSAPIRTAIPDGFDELIGDSSYNAIVGLDANCAIPEEEYKLAQTREPQNSDIASKESSTFDTAAGELNDRMKGQNLLCDGRLSVIFCDEATDVQKVYDHAVEKGHGSDEAREAVRKRLEDMSVVDETAMREHLVLSSEARLVKADGKRKTHNVQIVDPEFVAKEIKWVCFGDGKR